MRIDLHLHSTASDGTLSPSAVAWAAKAGGLGIIALADHDTTAGVAEAQAAAHGAPTVIPAIELSSTHGGAELHFLGYFIDPAHPALLAYCREAIERREERIRGMIHRLESLGVHVHYEDVLKAAGAEANVLGRPHLARALLARGYVQSFAEAFDRYLADGGPAFLPTELLTPREAVDLIHEAGGAAVWAHPPWEVLDRELGHFAEWGLDGLECFRPRNSTAEVARLLEAARSFDLLVTGGSDWHGGWHGQVGDFSVTRAQVEPLLALGGL